MTHKDQVIENIIAANSKAFRAQVAQHAIITSVIDDMLNDPQWADDLARYAASPRKNDTVRVGFTSPVNITLVMAAFSALAWLLVNLL